MTGLTSSNGDSMPHNMVAWGLVVSAAWAFPIGIAAGADMTPMPGWSTERITAMGPRFARVPADPAYVMPVGSGDLSAMVRVSDGVEIHLSKTDYWGWDAEPVHHRNPTLHSPGHIQLAIPGQSLGSATQRIDPIRGSVIIVLETMTGRIQVEISGVMGRNVLAIEIVDGRAGIASTTCQLTYSCWRAGVAVAQGDRLLLATERHSYDRNGKPQPLEQVAASTDPLLGLGMAVAVTGGADGEIAETTRPQATPTGMITCSGPAGAPLRAFIAAATSYDDSAQDQVLRQVREVLTGDPAALRQAQLAWWSRFWQASYIDVTGKDAEYLSRLWTTTMYSYAIVGGGVVPPAFNGGPGLVVKDQRSWGWKTYYQNQREMIWPMGAANRLTYAKALLLNFHALYESKRAETAKWGGLGIWLGEIVDPIKPGSTVRHTGMTAFDPSLLERERSHRIEDRRAQNVNHLFSQTAELVQQMIDYVAYSGDRDFLRNVAAPWLHEASLFYLDYLKRDEGGTWHMEPANAVETWLKVRDPAPDMAGIRYCFWNVVAHGREFGFESAFIDCIRDRLQHLAPIPVGTWKLDTDGKTTRAAGVDSSGDMYMPAGSPRADVIESNQENPELYAIFPFTMIDGNGDGGKLVSLERMTRTFRSRRWPNWAGWSQCPVQAARLRLPETIDTIIAHARRNQGYPYGGWNSPGKGLTGSQTPCSDAPYFDAAGVNATALQEALLQSHEVTSPSGATLGEGGVIHLLPAVRPDWSGTFRLRARGGFLVDVRFAETKPQVVRILSERGNAIKLANPYGRCAILVNGQSVGETVERLIDRPTAAGDLCEFIY